MKVRILDNSFRFRLKAPELEILQKKGKISETVEFGVAASSQLSFCLQVNGTGKATVVFQHNSIIFYLPEQLVDKWISTDMTGFSNEIEAEDGKLISLLVEKDFKCMAVCAENDPASFSQPAQAKEQGI